MQYWRPVKLYRWRFLGLLVSLLPSLVFAAPSLNLSTRFISADPARSNSYMDSGGVWNGNNEVSNTLGDTFELQITNTAAGLPNPLTDDVAFDTVVSISVPSGFRLPVSPFTVTTSASGGDPGAANCVVPGGGTVTAIQAGGAGTPITLNLSNVDLPGQGNGVSPCTYIFSFGLTTQTTAPFVQEGFYTLRHNIAYALTDGGVAQPAVQATQQIEVREGDVAVLKVADTAMAGNGDTVQFTVSILGSGTGGNFSVVLTDTLSSDLGSLTITAPVNPPGSVGPAANQHTFNYIAPGEQVDITITAVVNVNPAALSCPLLRNTAQAINRIGSSNSFFVDVPFNLDNPLLQYTAPSISVPFGGTQPYSIPVQNIGSGIARNISLRPLNLDAGFVISLPASETDWIWTGAVFQYIGNPADPNDDFLSAGQTSSIDFNVTVSSASCPGPSGGPVQWTPNYENICGTIFSPPLHFANSSVTNVPDLDISKIVSSPLLNIGQTGTYTITISGSDISTLPTDGIDNNNEFSVSDILPTGIGSAVINVIPSGTQIFINGSAVPYVASAPIPDGASIVWRGDLEDLQPVFPTLMVDFSVTAAACPGGQLIGNTANLAYPGCSIAESDTASFIANDNPAGPLGQNLSVASTPFQTGLADSNGIAGDANEGDHIAYIASYDFPTQPGPTPFPGQWSGSTFTADLGAIALAQALTLINTPVTVTVIRISDGATLLNNQAIPGGSLNVNGNGSMTITLSFIGGLIGDANVNDYRLEFRYAATAADATLGGASALSYIETTTLNLNGGPTDCSGVTTAFTQGATVSLARASVNFGIAINNGSPVEVCGIVPVTFNVSDPGNGTAADNLQLRFDQSRYEYLGGVVYGGELAAIANAPTPPQIDISTSGNDVFFTVNPNTTDYTAAGSLTFNARLRDNAAPTALTAEARYDDHQTSPDIGAAENDRDFNATVNITPEVLTGQLSVTFLPSSIVLVDRLNYSWTAQVVNVGTGTAYGAAFTTTLPVEFTPDPGTPATSCNSLTINPVISGQIMTWTLGDLPPGVSCNIIVRGNITQNSCFQPQNNVANQITSQAQWGCGTPILTSPAPPTPLIELPLNNLRLFHDIDDSFCELCGEGEIRLTINNTGSVEVSNIDVTEDLLASGLSYVNGSTQLRVNGGSLIAGPNPAITGTQLSWDFDNIVTVVNAAAPGTFSSNGLSSAFASSPANPRRVEIIYRVSSPGETLIDNLRNIQANATFDLFCNVGNSSGIGSLSTASTLFDVPFRQPVPTVIKQGRNVTAGQSVADYGASLPGLSAGDVAGGTSDDVIWRINIQNNLAFDLDDLEDLMVQDTIGRNFVMHSICPDEASATASANAGSTSAPCVAASNPLSNTLDADPPFGNADAVLDVLRNSNEFVYFVGRIQNLCQNHNNTSSITWGCETNPPGGDIGAIDANTPGVNASVDDDDVAFMSTTVNPAGLLITQTVTGSNSAQPLGTKGIMTITVRNQTGGTITGLQLAADLPTDYEYDNTLRTLAVTPAFSNYTGMVDTVAENILSTSTVPVFDFTSSTLSAISARNHVLRHGDVFVLTIGLVRALPFDSVSNPEVRQEAPNSTPVANTDPDYAPAGATDDDSVITLQFDDTCPSTPAFTTPISNTLNVNINPEDLDVDINPSDPNLLFILSDPAATLTLDVILSNNGGHDASDYDAYVTIGNGIAPGVLPAGCSGPLAPPPPELGAPPSQPSGILPPEYNPADSKTYRCALRDPLPPGASDIFRFVVQRALPVGVSGDLTFRADILARTTRSNDTSPPGAAQAGYPYYSKDNILARIIGFNLFKRQDPNCTEDNPPPLSNRNLIIGEECTYQIEANWFGFATPGFGNIEIRNARIYEGSTGGNPPAFEANPATDPPSLPPAVDGQGFLRVDTSTSSSGISVAVQNPPAPAALTETGLGWRLHPIIATGNTEERFIADVTFRVLNDPLNNIAAPNQHGAGVSDEANARFDVYFTANNSTLSFNENTIGYPPTGFLQVNARITEPNITIEKTLCNETMNGTVNPTNPDTGPTCSNFANSISGDSDDLYVYVLRIRNVLQTGIFQHAPAFDIAVTDIMDPADQMIIRNPATDGLDNDLDGLIDAADINGEGTLVTDGVPENGVPEQVIFTPAQVPNLLKIPAGQEVVLFYRAEPQDSVVPTQIISNTVSAGYDSLPGASGNQTAPFNPPNSGETGGAREYTSGNFNATLNILPLVINPGSKRFSAISRRNDPNGPVTGAPPPCAVPCVAESVVIGEEIQIELEFDIPPSQLNNFLLTDLLPDGIECIEIEPILLPTSDFLPGSTGPDPLFGTPQDFVSNPYNPVTGKGFACDANRVQWDFGDQALFQVSDPGRTTYQLVARFIVRVQNLPSNQDLVVLSNGGGTTPPSPPLGPTIVQVSYDNASGTQISQVLGQADLTIQEPQIVIAKTLELMSPATSVDADDLMRVRVLVQNNGTSPAYNLRILDDLSATGINMNYLIEMAGGANPPDTIIDGNLNRPIFGFNNPLMPGNSFEFTFRVRATPQVAPLEQLDNTIFAHYTSLPDNSIALNATGAIGADGAGNGVRNGSLPAVIDPLNDYEAQATAFQTVPALSIVKTDLDAAVVPTIGARKRFQVTVNLPESTTQNLVVRDNLSAGTTGFILENNTAFDIVYTFQNILSINGNAVSGFTTPADAEAAMVSFNAVDAATGVINWNFGTVITGIEEDPINTAINPAIIINYIARVANDVSTVAGASLQNLASIDYTHGENASTVITNAPVVGPFTVVEPDLRMNKIYIDLPAPNPPGSVVQGVPIQYEMQVNNVGGASAWDVNITDYLPNQTDPVPPLNNRMSGGMCDTTPVITSIDVGGRALSAGVDYTASFQPPASDSDLFCTFSIRLIPSNSGAPADNARIEAGETLIIRYQTLLDIGTPSGINLTNVAGIDEWFSLDTDGNTVPPEIRRYTRNITLPPSPNPGTVGINDHEDAETVLTQSPVISILKTVENLSTGQNPALTASPGNTLRYTLTLENTGPVSGSSIRVTDDPDALNVLNFAEGYFENSPAGSLRNITVSTTATDNSQASGGVIGSGFLDLSDISILPGSSVVITYDIDIEDVDTALPHALIENQANVDLPGFLTISSNATQTEIINIRAGFVFEKNSQDLSGNPNILESGDTLRYTIRIKNTGDPDPNIGLTHAVNSVFTDQIPANTRYVANSTILNGVAIADSQTGESPISNGMLINSPDTNLPGLMLANRDMSNTANVALVTFDVIVNDNLVNGTVISNQAVLTGQEQALSPFAPVAFTAQFSDDPRTPDVPHDPTQDVLGSGVNLDVLKTVAVITGGDNIPNTGETLRYTLTVVNRGNVAATNVRLMDNEPAGTAFISGSLTLNGVTVSDSGNLPLITGLAIHSRDLTPPLPAFGAGRMNPGEVAVVNFDAIITAGNGAIISNQGRLSSNEQPDEPTDADGNDENGDQPTLLTVGNLADLEITKEAIVVGGGVVTVNGYLDYQVHITNRGTASAMNVLITDTIPAGTTYISGSGLLNGFPAGVNINNNVLTATVGSLAAGDTALLRFRIRVNPDPAGGNRLGDAIENTARVTADGGINASDSAHIDVGGAPGVSNISGRVWDNRVHDRLYDPQTDVPAIDWIVRVYVNNNTPLPTDTFIAEARSNTEGRYVFNGLAPVDPSAQLGAYTLTFTQPADPALYPAGSAVAAGQAESDFGVAGLSVITNISVRAGRNAQNENLPVESTGFVYNSVTRRPVSGARLMLLDVNGTPLPESCFNTPSHLSSQQGQISAANGFYRFDLNFSNSNCPAGVADYQISVELQNADGQFVRNISNVIPPETPALDVSTCPDTINDRLPSPPVNTCEIQPQVTIPDPLIPSGLGTRYFLDLSLRPSSARLYHNHIPVDQDVGALVSISKQTPLKNVVRGQLIPYNITVSNTQDFAITSLEVRDFFPAGFKYIEGSATINGQQTDPEADTSSFFNSNLNAGTLSWRGLTLLPQSQITLKLLLVVGAGVGEGEYVNRAQAFITGLITPISEQASATVRVIPDPTFDCSDVIGKVFDDKNSNAYQDEGESGIAGVRLVTPRGLLVTTDQYGRFHIVCADVPNPDRGSNFIIKLDERSLPSGYRLTTENPLVERLTRGKVSKFNFGATRHHVVRLDLADAAFIPNRTELRDYWLASFEQLFGQLRTAPSILRLSYLADIESIALVEQRLEAIKLIIENRWRSLNCCYALTIETEVFWRRGEAESSELRQ